jgi:OOP family OmpA-OmpF porin
MQSRSNMNKTTLALALCALGSIAASPAYAQTEAKPGYLNSSSGIVRSGTGLCWHTGSWTPAQAVEGCDPVVPVAQVDPYVQPMKKEEPADYVLSAPRVEFAELNGVVHFGFDRSELTSEGKMIVDDLAAKALSAGSSAQSATVVGFTDRFGSEGYNHGLAMRRAKAVAARLMADGVPARVLSVREEGKSHPLVECSSAMASVIKCLAPNRRVEIVIELINAVKR